MAKSTIKIKGELEIDHLRGVVYFHSNDPRTPVTPLRICRLPTPIPANVQIDITHMHGVSYVGEQPKVGLVAAWVLDMRSLPSHVKRDTQAKKARRRNHQ